MEGFTVSCVFCETRVTAYAGAFREGEVAPSVGNCYSDDDSNNTTDEKRKKEMKGRCSLCTT